MKKFLFLKTQVLKPLLLHHKITIWKFHKPVSISRGFELNRTRNLIEIMLQDQIKAAVMFRPKMFSSKCAISDLVWLISI